jgi:hypothetical protein
MKIRKAISILFMMILIAVKAFGQDCEDGPGLPGDDPDAPTTGCEVPLDTWVFALAGGAVIFGSIKLYKKNKMQIG